MVRRMQTENLSFISPIVASCNSNTPAKFSFLQMFSPCISDPGRFFQNEVRYMARKSNKRALLGMLKNVSVSFKKSYRKPQETYCVLSNQRINAKGIFRKKGWWKRTLPSNNIWLNAFLKGGKCALLGGRGLQFKQFLNNGSSRWLRKKSPLA